MRVALIAAMARNRVIGAGNRLPWSLPEDLKRFRAITSGHPVIMGRRTFESIGRPLPKRENIVVTRNRDFRADGVKTAGSIEEALEICRCLPAVTQDPEFEVFVIGGGEIYRQAIGQAQKLYITRIEQDIEGDAWFPEWSDREFRRVSSELRSEPFRFSFDVYERVTGR